MIEKLQWLKQFASTQPFLEDIRIDNEDIFHVDHDTNTNILFDYLGDESETDKNVNIIKYLLSRSEIDINLISTKCYNILMEYLSHQGTITSEMVTLLLKSGVDPEYISPNGDNAMFVYIRYQSTIKSEVVEALVKGGVDINYQNIIKNCITPILYAAVYKHTYVTYETLVQHGAKIHQKDSYGRNIFSIYITYICKPRNQIHLDEKTMSYLVSEVPPDSTRDLICEYYRYPVTGTIQKRIVKFLINLGFTVNLSCLRTIGFSKSHEFIYFIIEEFFKNPHMDPHEYSFHDLKEFFLNHDININTVDSLGSNYLMMYLQYNNNIVSEMVSLFFEFGVDPTHTNMYGENALSVYIRCQSTIKSEVVEALIKGDVDINHMNPKNNHSPLLYTLLFKHIPSVYISLITYGTKLSNINFHDRLVFFLYFIYIYNNREQLNVNQTTLTSLLSSVFRLYSLSLPHNYESHPPKYLLNYQISKLTHFDKPTLIGSLSHNDMCLTLSCVEFIIDSEPPPSLIFSLFEILCYISINLDNISTLQDLISKYNIDINLVDDESSNLLMIYLRHNRNITTEIVSLFLDSGVNSTHTNKDGYNALSVYIRYNTTIKPEVVETLIKGGVDVKNVNPKNNLMVPILYEGKHIVLVYIMNSSVIDPDIFSYLLSVCNIGINYVDDEGYNLLMFYLLNHKNVSPHVVSFLLDVGVDPHYTDSHGFNLLIGYMYTVGKIESEVVEVLVKGGVDINYVNQSDDSMTPILYAAETNRSEDVYETLVKHGANMHVLTRHKHNILMVYLKNYALKHNHNSLSQKTMEYLMSHVSLNHSDVDGYNVLYQYCCLFDTDNIDFSIVEMLLDAGVDPVNASKIPHHIIPAYLLSNRNKSIDSRIINILINFGVYVDFTGTIQK